MRPRPTRRRHRRPGYDYRRPGWYFITICTKDKRHYFGCIRQRKMQLSAMGNIAHSCWESIPEHYPFVSMDAFVIMPDHMHGLIRILPQRLRGPREGFSRPSPQSLAAVIRSYKAAVARECRLINEAFLWHVSYYDRMVESTSGLQAVRMYIRANPSRWKGPFCKQ